MRIHIGFLGRRNTGKSSLLNALTGQTVSIVSNAPGTTTDPVKKTMELHDLGPVLFYDTAGVDDEGSVGELRVRKTKRILNRLDIGIIVTTPYVWSAYESFLLYELEKRDIPIIIVINKCDTAQDDVALYDCIPTLSQPILKTSAISNQGIDKLRQTIVKIAPSGFFDDQDIVGDLISRGRCVVLVTPIDEEAPRGRLILPQVQAIRDALDNHAWCAVCRESELAVTLLSLTDAPDLVVTDSQAFKIVDKTVPREIPLTSFSILYSRLKGDLIRQAEGVRAIDSLITGNRVLIAEYCSHHAVKGDIGREKIPALIRSRTGQDVFFEFNQGDSFPEDLHTYSLVIHCGACTANRQEVLSRIRQCNCEGVPITNYGMTIAYCLGILERALEPFPDALKVYREAMRYVES